MKLKYYLNNLTISLILFVSFLLISTAQGTSTQGSYYVRDILLDGSASSLGSLWTASYLEVGDDISNDTIRAYIKFNATTSSANISSIRNNLTSVRLWLYGVGTVSISTTPDMLVSYHYNDSWTTSLKGSLAGSANNSDYLDHNLYHTGMWMNFELKNAYIYNETDNIISIQIKPTAVTANSIINRLQFGSSESANDPYLEFVYDNNTYNGTHYKTMAEFKSPYNYNGDNFSTQGFFIPGALLLEDGTKVFFMDIRTATRTIINNTPPNFITLNPNYQSFTTTPMTGMGESGTIDECYAVQNALRNASVCYQILDKKTYFNTDIEKKIFARGETTHAYNNFTPFHVGNGTYALGTENFYNVTGGVIKINGIYKNITQTYFYESEELFSNATGGWSLGYELVDAIREQWFAVNTPNISFMVWNWQLHNTVLKRGSLRLKDKNQHIVFDNEEMGGYSTVKNRTMTMPDTDNIFFPLQYQYVARNATYGTLVLNFTLHQGTALSKYQFMNVSGMWVWANGTIFTIPNAEAGAFSEFKLTRGWDYIDWVQNAYITDERIDADRIVSNLSDRDLFNFSVRGNAVSNISVGIYNSSKLFNSSRVLISNTIGASWNNLSLSGTGTYQVKALNVSVDVSLPTEIQVKNYSSLLFNFTNTNSSGITVYNDTFTILSGYTYKVLHNGTSQELIEAVSDNISFNILTGDYQIVLLTPAPNITDWRNSNTSNNTLDFTVMENTPVIMNITTNQSIITYEWFQDGVDQKNNYDNWTHTFLTEGLTRNITVIVTNPNGSASLKWNVSIIHNNTYIPPVIPPYYVPMAEEIHNITDIGDFHNLNWSEGFTENYQEKISAIPSVIYTYNVSATTNASGLFNETLNFFYDTKSPTTQYWAIQFLNKNNGTWITVYSPINENLGCSPNCYAYANVTGLLLSDYMYTNGTIYEKLLHSTNGNSNHILRVDESKLTLEMLPSYPPVINSWGNNFTNNDSLSFSVEENTNILFNFTANQSLESYTWAGATNLTGSTADHNFSSHGIKQVSVYGTNLNGSTQTITWSINVNDTYPEPSYVFPVSSDNDIYLSQENFVYRINGTSGEIIFKMVMQRLIVSNIIIGNDNIYFNSLDTMYSVNKTTGKIINKNRFGQGMKIFSMVTQNLTTIII